MERKSKGTGYMLKPSTFKKTIAKEENKLDKVESDREDKKNRIAGIKEADKKQMSEARLKQLSDAIDRKQNTDNETF